MRLSINIQYVKSAVITLIICAFLLTGCAGAPSADTTGQSTSADQATDIASKPIELTDGPISSIRTGIVRQGISGQFKSFECTEDRVYFMTNVTGVPLLYYCTHDSDELLPVCTKSNCEHKGVGCEAYFTTNGNVCYYSGYLYVDSGTVLYRLNPDGSNREEVLDISKAIGGDYDGIAEPIIWNGIFSFYLTKYDAAGTGEFNDVTYEQTKYDPYYYKLDGSMTKPEPMENLIAQYNDGTDFLMRGPAEKEELYYENSKLIQNPSERLLFAWDPNKNTSQQLVDYTEIVARYYSDDYIPEDQMSPYNSAEMRSYEAFGEGYWGTACAYYLMPVIENNKVVNNLLCKLNYSDGTSEILLDTGLKGSYRLCCFPDCIVLCQTVDYESANLTTTAKQPVLYFYNWDYKLLGQCKIDMDIGISPEDMICGESDGRIYLAVHFLGVPEYYIDKNELGTGAVTPHTLTYDGIDPAKSYQEIIAKLMELN